MTLEEKLKELEYFSREDMAWSEDSALGYVLAKQLKTALVALNDVSILDPHPRTETSLRLVHDKHIMIAVNAIKEILND